MSSLNPASGDSSELPISLQKDGELPIIFEPITENPVQNESQNIIELNDNDDKEQVNSEQENNLKERIKQCRNIIESLKMELNHEKARLEKESKSVPLIPEESKVKTDSMLNLSLDSSCSPNFYTSCVENKLNCDENLIQYERQLQRYQNTLNMAQIEKKNAIRKQMIAKAYKLKLLEVENQCNIELLRVKQSLQCLEPLQMIANKWKTNTDENAYDLNSFELMPRFPELNGVSGSDISSSTGDSENKNKTAITLN